ncbi:MAG: glycosyl transferase family 1 [Deltaproteobacteria bacterium RIFOXYA12_FULL_58_15]|nr:MAG: glycosyl transferase family 1 [Deltaproteobacteria bacterium RIFOXYA12_FULL_58_15]OGR07992.1 MAG: glycosyl transferase family 1 [Deltaproteobacteria bacterium RIFOXYB12_FULL_58_9]
MKATIISKEYPPHVYGGAGVHVKFLTRELAKRMAVEVRCFGEQKLEDGNLQVSGYRTWARMWEGDERRFNSVLGTLSVDLSVVRDPIDSDIVHTHTWYAAWAGFLAKKLYGIPLVCTVHSLEPLRPWKEEQLGASYRLSSWAEKVTLENADRIVAVSHGSRKDIIDLFDVNESRVEVIHNGIDLDLYRPVNTDGTLKAYGIDQDYILFVGRVSRQKGIEHLIDAVDMIAPSVKIVLCTSAPDTKELQAEIAAKVAAQPRIVWINSLLREDQYVELYAQARLFVCPSVYEPFGIINLEAMACETPIVASRIGGILETVVDGETGILVEPGSPVAIADAVNQLLKNPERAAQFGKNGRKRVEDHFSWPHIADQTVGMYERVVEQWRSRAE